LRRIPGFAKARNIVVIRNGIAAAQFCNPKPADIRQLLGLDANVRVFGFFGRFMEQKGFLDLVEAAGRLKRTREARDFVVVCVGAGDYLKEYRQAVVDAELTEALLFLPRVENPAPLMAGCDAVIMPSRWEAYPLQAPEVLCLGVPLIASDCLGLREVTPGTPARTFTTADVAGLAEAMSAELAQPSREAARAYAPTARVRFDFQPSAKAIYRLLQMAQTGRRLTDFLDEQARATPKTI
jgi:glycosyltransferase involved in cell wall biosynthesis